MTTSQRLWFLGFLDHPTDTETAAAIKLYQAFHGLRCTGKMCKKTTEHLNQRRFCSHPDLMAVGETIVKWPINKITWSLISYLPSLPQADQKDAAEMAWRAWANVCNITPVYSPNDRTAMVPMNVGAIDGPAGTLAWSELPYTGVRQTRQMYDTAERWVIKDAPATNEIDLLRVMIHELGHALGIPHISGKNIMAPIYDTSLRSLQSGDVLETVARYGVKADPSPPPSPPPTEEYIINFSTPVSRVILKRG